MAWLWIIAALACMGWLEERVKRRRAAVQETERHVEARVAITRERISKLEPRMGQPRDPSKRGFECIERVD
jgi:hypothetical protein